MGQEVNTRSAGTAHMEHDHYNMSLEGSDFAVGEEYHICTFQQYRLINIFFIARQMEHYGIIIVNSTNEAFPVHFTRFRPVNSNYVQWNPDTSYL